MFYLLKIWDCPEFDNKFTAEQFSKLNKTEESERKIEIFPVYNEDGPAIIKCYCNGQMKVPGMEAEIDVLFESNEHIDGCHLRVRTDQVSKEELEFIRKYFGVDNKDIEESDT